MRIHGADGRATDLSWGRFSLLLILLLGFSAMHGMTATQASGAHQHSVAGVNGMDQVDIAPVDIAQIDASHISGGHGDDATSPNDEGGQHEWMTGCVLALSGLASLVLVTRGLRVVGSRIARPRVSLRSHGRPGWSRPAWSPAVAPFFLCVLRV